MSRIIDADSHFMEPLDLWERYIEPRHRPRCLRFRQEADGRYVMLVNEDKAVRGVGEFSMEQAARGGRGLRPEGRRLGAGPL